MLPVREMAVGASPAIRSGGIACGRARGPARVGAVGMRLGSVGGWNPIDQNGLEAAPMRAPGATHFFSADGKAAYAAIGSTTMLVCTCARPTAY